MHDAHLEYFVQPALARMRIEAATATAPRHPKASAQSWSTMRPVLTMSSLLTPLVLSKRI